MGNSDTNTNTVPILSGFFEGSGETARLIGVKCRTCGTYAFPKFRDIHKPGCAKRDLEEVLLSKTGKLQTYTIQYFQPPPVFIGPDPFVPYAIGSVALPEGISVLGIITDCVFEELKVGMQVELLAETLYTDANGREFQTWKFRPARH
jgi:uncharacterized OB-fold protein